MAAWKKVGALVAFRLSELIEIVGRLVVRLFDADQTFELLPYSFGQSRNSCMNAVTPPKYLLLLPWTLRDGFEVNVLGYI